MGATPKLEPKAKRQMGSTPKLETKLLVRVALG